MKRLLYLAVLVLLASCSSQKYAAHFQKTNHDYGYGELVEHPASAKKSAQVPTETFGPVVASTSKDAAIIIDAPKTETPVSIEEVKKNYAQLTKSEKKEFRREIKKQAAKMIKAKEKGETYVPMTVNKTQTMDQDLKLAAIFGAVGVVALIIGTNAFWVIGGISLLIAVVFFVMWLVRQ